MQTVDFNSDVSVRVIGCDAGTTLMKNANNREKCVCMRVCMCVYARVCVWGERRYVGLLCAFHPMFP